MINVLNKNLHTKKTDFTFEPSTLTLKCEVCPLKPDRSTCLSKFDWNNNIDFLVNIFFIERFHSKLEVFFVQQGDYP